MFIVPLEKKLDWERPPVVTLLLIAINVMVLFFIQGDVANDYGFTPASAAPSTFLTHMFLHGSLAHLLGNMLFLLIIGLAVELTLGWRTYLGFYLGCGLAAVVLYWAVYSTSEVPLVGASGAIAGLMGLYAVLFGARRIRFFYWVVVYFDYVKAPAIIMFPIWLANELIQLAWGGVSSVAYVAHIGGLLAGGSLAAAIRGRPGRVDTDYLDSSEREQTRNTELEKVRKLLGSLEVDRAKTSLKMLAKEYPNDREIRLQIYRVEKFDPQTEAYHHAALRFLNLPREGPDSLRESHEVFLDYIEATDGRIRLPPVLLGQLSIRFAKGGFVTTSAWIVKKLLTLQSRVQGLEQALVSLAKAYHQRGDHSAHQQYLKSLINHFPNGEAAKTARGVSGASREFRQ